MITSGQLWSFLFLEKNGVFKFGPFNSAVPRRWKKQVNSARTRLENRTLDSKLDKLMVRLKNLKRIMGFHDLIMQERNGYASLQLMSQWRHEVGLRIRIGEYVAKYPRIFEVFTHPVTRNLCCKVTKEMTDLIADEVAAIRENEPTAAHHLKKLLLLSADRTLNVHALWLVRRQLGLPDDFRSTILCNYPCDFTMACPETVSLLSCDENAAVAAVEKWRETEYTDKWLRESETKYAFPINFPTGFQIEKGFRDKLKNWQMLPYCKPYDKNIPQSQNLQKTEKRAVGVMHELLSLTVEKMMPVERLSHFRRPFQMEVNVRELLLKHPGIFYISTKGSAETVFLREGYIKGCLVESNPIHDVRRRMLGLLLPGQQNTGEGKTLFDTVDENSECAMIIRSSEYH